ncbi:hypothetical protein GQ54DRAFT_314312 [Martensiomyces pterosporus]|nr:hypothetical protein GQ54DRAFT_314312 [Martensiomyces pterosporus]
MFGLVDGHKRRQAVDMWKLSRRILALVFSVSAMRVYGEEMAEAARGAEPLLDSHGPEHSIDVLSFTAKLAFQTTSMGGIGYGFRTLGPSNTEQHAFRPRFWKRLPLGVNYRFGKRMGVLKEIVQTCVDQLRNPPDTASMKKGRLDCMLIAQAPDKNRNLAGLGNGLIFDQILAVSIVGYETPANTLARVLYLVDKHPGIQQDAGSGSSSAELYFDCRSPEYDYLYMDKLNAYAKDSTLTKLHPSYWHTGDAHKHIQHRITANGASTWKSLNETNGRIHVCGLADG